MTDLEAYELIGERAEELTKRADVQKKMKKAAADLDFETAATLRDRMIELKKIYEQNRR